MYIPVDMIEPVLAVVLGVLSLFQPKMVHYFVAVFLLVFGVIRLAPLL